MTKDDRDTDIYVERNFLKMSSRELSVKYGLSVRQVNRIVSNFGRLETLRLTVGAVE